MATVTIDRTVLAAHHVAPPSMERRAARSAWRLAVVPTPLAQPALTRQARALSRTLALVWWYEYTDTVERGAAVSSASLWL